MERAYKAWIQLWRKGSFKSALIQVASGVSSKAIFLFNFLFVSLLQLVTVLKYGILLLFFARKIKHEKLTDIKLF